MVVLEEAGRRVAPEGRFAVRALPPVPLKGVPEPMRIYEVSANP